MHSKLSLAHSCSAALGVAELAIWRAPAIKKSKDVVEIVRGNDIDEFKFSGRGDHLRDQNNTRPASSHFHHEQAAPETITPHRRETMCLPFRRRRTQTVIVEKPHYGSPRMGGGGMMGGGRGMMGGGGLMRGFGGGRGRAAYPSRSRFGGGRRC
ncbi:hypothetical protein BST61_g3660 [Cercospora zeina]